jgi:hypothetical protein
LNRPFGGGGKTAVERDEAAFAAGCEAARADVASGRLVYRWSGHTGHWGHWIATQLAERFGVAVSDGFGVCFVTASRLSFDDGYNSVLVTEINRRHGSGAFESLLAESRQQSEETLWAAKQLWLQRHPEAAPGTAADRGRHDGFPDQMDRPAFPVAESPDRQRPRITNNE